jgi:prophage antirepressor-like protein
MSKKTGIVVYANETAAFEFKGHKVRTAGTWERPLFCAADVCEVLGLGHVGRACERLDHEDVEEVAVKEPNRTTDPGAVQGGRLPLYVTESGLYQLVLGSRKPEARPFKRWVTGEVLPAIRKYGYYSAIEVGIREQRDKLLAEYFPNLPGYATELFSGLLDELLRKFGWCPAKPGPKVARRGPGAPPWGSMVAGWVYDWGIKIEGQQEHRRKINPAPKGGRTRKSDYSALSELARETIERICDHGTRMIRISSSWEDWRLKMEMMYGAAPVRMAALPIPENQTAFGFLGMSA